MAIYHCSVKVISRSSGASAVAAGAYRSGEKIKDEKTGLTHDYTKKDGVDDKDILAPDNAPDWVYNRSELWNNVESSEKRKDSQLCREIQVALPKELNLQQNKKLVNEFISEQCVSKGMIADVAIHHAKGGNPHAHVLLTTRSITKDGFGPKNRDWNKKEVLEQWRESWQEKTNHHLEKHGHQTKIDHRTLKAQGVNRIPQIHLGSKVAEMEERGIRTDRGAQAFKIDRENEKIISLQECKEAIENERDREIEKIQNNRGASSRSGAISPSYGDFSESDHRAFEQPTRSEHSSHTTMDRSPNASSERVGESSDQHGTSNESNDSNSQQQPEDDLIVDSQQFHVFVSWFSDRYDSALGRIKNLVLKTKPQLEEKTTEQDDKLLDRTYLAVRRQLSGMNCKSYEVGVRNPEGKMLIRNWSPDEVLKSVSWLKRENAQGSDIYIRPGGDKNQGLILIDDVNKKQLETMKSRGFEPCVVVETSPYNHQAWVRVDNKPLENKEATMASKILAKVADSDPNSADWRHFGRLSGFTNQKPEHKTSRGRSPWSLCHVSNQTHATNGQKLVDYSKQSVLEIDAQRESETRSNRAIQYQEGPSCYDPVRNYKHEFQALSKQYGANIDLSKADYMICKTMAMQGFDKRDLMRALEKASPELPKRKAGHELDYCQRTVKAAFEHPQVKEHLKQQKELSRSNDRGFGR